MAAPGSGFPRPCCGYLTLPDEPPGTFFICPVCRWDDDNWQFDDINLRGRRQPRELEEAQANFRRLGTSDHDRRGQVRPPLPHER
jgi:Cysteine-rich CPCC